MRTVRGMSFIEMIVAILIMLLGMSGFTYLFVDSWRSNKYIIEMGNASLLVSRAVNNLVADLRKVRQADNGDFPIESGSDFDIKVYIDIDNDGVTERVHYYLQSGSLYRGVREPVGNLPVNYPNGDGTTTLLANSIINSNSQPVFSYYNDEYPSDTINNPLATPVNVAEVKMVKVHLMINIDPLNVPEHINVESFAELRNLNGY